MPAGVLWTKVEEEALCRAWVYCTRDAEVGADQSMDTFWNSVATSLYNRIVETDTSYVRRSPKATRNKFAALAPLVNAFVSIYKRGERVPVSGQNGQDLMASALAAYRATHGADFEHLAAWGVLRDEPKFMGYMKKRKADSHAAGESGKDHDDRPIGNKKAKAMRVEEHYRAKEVKELRRLADAVAERNRIAEIQTNVSVMTQPEPVDPDAREYLRLVRQQILEKARERASNSRHNADRNGGEEYKDDVSSDEDKVVFEPSALV